MSEMADNRYQNVAIQYYKIFPAEWTCIPDKKINTLTEKNH